MKISILALLTCLSLTTFAQETVYTTDNCASLIESISAADGPVEIPIEVSGQDIMGLDKIGIVEAYIDIDQPTGFYGVVDLISPTNQRFTLAALPAFPGYAGTTELEEDIVDVETTITTTGDDGGGTGTAMIEILNVTNVIDILWDNGQTGLEANGLEMGTHTVTVTTSYGCMFTYTFEIDLIFSTYEWNSLESFKVYPTVFYDLITLEASLKTANNLHFRYIWQINLC